MICMRHNDFNKRQWTSSVRKPSNILDKKQTEPAAAQKHDNDRTLTKLQEYS